MPDVPDAADGGVCLTECELSVVAVGRDERVCLSAPVEPAGFSPLGATGCSLPEITGAFSCERDCAGEAVVVVVRGERLSFPFRFLGLELVVEVTVRSVQTVANSV